MTGLFQRGVRRFLAALPGRDALHAYPLLRPLAHRLASPQLWRLHHEAVARGVAIGIFWAFVLPVAQAVVAAAHCSWWRANIPVAVGMTFLTNPFTIGFWLWLGYQTGSAVLGNDVPGSGSAGGDLLGTLAALGWPTALGMGIFAVAGAAAGYGLVRLGWRLGCWYRRRSRQQRRAVRAGA